MKKAHPVFQLQTGDAVRKYLHFQNTSNGMVSFTLDGEKVGDSWKKVFVAFNGTEGSKQLHLPKGNWRNFALNNHFTTQKALPTTISPYSTIILFEQ